MSGGLSGCDAGEVLGDDGGGGLGGLPGLGGGGIPPDLANLINKKK